MRHQLPDADFLQEDLDRRFGTHQELLDELEDHARAREDRIADYFPAQHAPHWMTTPAAPSSNGPPSSPAFAPPTAREVGGCRREGGGPSTF